MGLEETIKETKAKLEEAEKLEGVEQKEEEIEEKPIEEKIEEKPVEEEKKEVKTPADYAKERRAAKASKLSEELAAANARIAELTKAKEEPKVAEPEPDATVDPKAYADWRTKKLEEEVKPLKSEFETWRRERQQQALREQAEGEIQTYEAEVRQQHPDYDDVKGYYANMLAASIKIVNPKITNDKLIKMVNERLVHRASELLNDGHENPIAQMYDEAVKLGYKAKSTEVAEDEVKPNLAKVAANRARNAGTASAQGDGGRGELTAKVAVTMTNAEFARLKPNEKAAIFKQLGATG